MKNIFRGITKGILLLGLVSLFTDLTSQMIFPLIPLYLTSVLHANASVVGIVEGAAETTASLFKVFSGYLSDKIKKRKPFILIGYGLSSFIKPLFAIANIWPFVLVIRVIERIGKGLRDAPRDAMLADMSDKSVRGKVYGFHRSMDGLGSVLGAVLAIILLPLLGYKNIFLISFIPGIIVVLFILLLKEKKPKEPAQKQIFKFSFKKLPLNLKLLVIGSAVFSLGHFGYPFLLLKAKSAGVTDNNSIILYAIFYLVYTFCTIPAGILSDKFGRKKILIGGYIVYTLVAFGLIFADNINTLLIAFVVYGIFYAMVDGVQRAFAVDLSPPELEGTSLGALQTAIGLCALPGGYFAGVLWDVFGPSATFIYGGVSALISIVIFAFVKVRHS